ncbi:MAG: Fur family transcriptional regulator, peroxide stress response regulator [Candidatus Binataceae bacterium]|jgi:Fur family peroxide stress response transcriptional regulator|nr:Fur family transcriptional regulator, peroxide stress response regulator [Candidatus Binataceae bacterium]
MKFQIVNDNRRGAYARGRMAHFAERCRYGGLAVTPQRLAIIEALLATTDHPRAETIFAAVRQLHPHISLATVHRTLETLCAIGEARKVTTLHDSARYDGNLAPHHHVVCVRCRRIRDVEISGLERVIDGHAGLKGFQPLGWSLEIQALCDSCRKSDSDAGRPRRRNPPK